MAIDPKYYLEAIFDDDAVMAGCAAVRKQLMLRVGDKHAHAEAFRDAIIQSMRERRPD